MYAYRTDREWKAFEIRYWTELPDVQAACKFLTVLLPTVHTIFAVSMFRFLPLSNWQTLSGLVKRLGQIYDTQWETSYECEG